MVTIWLIMVYGFHKWGYPQHGWFMMEHPMKMDVHTPISGNIYIYIYDISYVYIYIQLYRAIDRISTRYTQSIPLINKMLSPTAL